MTLPYETVVFVDVLHPNPEKDYGYDLDFRFSNGKAFESKDDAILLKLGKIKDELAQDKARVLQLTSTSQDDLDAVATLLAGTGFDPQQIRTKIKSG